MSSTNQSPFYKKAETNFLSAKTDEEKIKFLEEMIKECPKHKSSEAMLANLKTRYKKLKEQLTKSKKSGKGSKKGIKKEEMQTVIIGETNSGKSSLLNLLTNANPEIASYKFTTKSPIVAMMPFSGINIQLIENPAIESEFYDKGLTNTANTLLIIITNLEQLERINQELKDNLAKKIIVFNDKDNLNQNQLRKLEATLKSRKYDFIILNFKENVEADDNNLIISSKGWASNFTSVASRICVSEVASRSDFARVPCYTLSEQGYEWGEGVLKEKIFQSLNKIRVYTKEPGKPKSEKPVILNPEATVKDIAEKILHGFSDKIKETKIWGPSSKFPGQKVSLNHVLKDLDVVEFKTK